MNLCRRLGQSGGRWGGPGSDPAFPNAPKAKGEPKLPLLEVALDVPVCELPLALVPFQLPALKIDLTRSSRWAGPASTSGFFFDVAGALASPGVYQEDRDFLLLLPPWS